jgi:AAA+ superfamily predicted ATPase
VSSPITRSVHDVRAEIGRYLRARVPLILLLSVEEQRVLQLLEQVRAERDPSADMITWDLSAGFASLSGRSLTEAARPNDALDKIDTLVKAEPRRRDLYVLKDFHVFWDRDPQVRRNLRNLAQRLVLSGSSVIITAGSAAPPEDLRDDTVVVDLPLPDAETLAAELDRLLAPGTATAPPPEQRTRLARAAVGLTASQARRAFATALVGQGRRSDHALDAMLAEKAVLAEKKRAIRQDEALEYFPVAETPDDVGGMRALKSWLTLRERAFSQEAGEFGLPAPKGLALIGIPGTGKSLTAKMIGGMWRLPLLRLDIGALFGSLLGESEERMRRALRLAEALAPCVLWIDELDKTLTGHGEGGGVTQRMLGSLLTWMQEKSTAVFVVATANDVASIPPEVLRRGRFDEVFFLDLPTMDERREILAVHLRRRRRDPAAFDLPQLARVGEGFVGAELEQAIIDALYHAFAEHRDLRTADIAEAMARTVPLNTSHAEAIAHLRGWLRDGRARSASAASPTHVPPEWL